MAGKITTSKKKSNSKHPKKINSTRKKKATFKKHANELLGTCFVMMPFKEPFNSYYDSIFKPAIESAALKPIRADDLFRPSVIVADLWQMIQDTKVLLAELTTKNANVFYELGLAHAIGKPVVLVAETMDDVPFDLQQLRVLLYDKNDPSWGEKLMDNITYSIQETLSSPVESVPSIFRRKVKSQAPEEDATLARIEALEREVMLIRPKTIQSKALTSWGLMEIELSKVQGKKELESWIRRWYRRGYSADELKHLIIDYDLPPETDMILNKILKETS